MFAILDRVGETIGRSECYIVADQQLQHCFRLHANFCRVGASVSDSVVVGLRPRAPSDRRSFRLASFSPYYLPPKMAPSLQAKDLAKICYYAAVNKKLPEEDLQAQWEALSQDPEALMRVSNRFGELRSEALISVQPESSLYEAFYQRFINETGTRLTLHQYATIAEDARMRAPRVNWAHENQITKLRKHQDMKEAKPEVMAQANTEEQAALHDNTTPLDGLRGLWNLGSTCYANAVWKMFANCDVFVSALMNLDMSKLAQATLLEHHSVELQHNVKQFTEFAALLVQFYRDLGDLADPKPIHPTRLMVSDLLDV